MARTSLPSLERRKHPDRQRKRRILIATTSIAVSSTIMLLLGPTIFRQPQHTSSLGGHAYTLELLNGHSGTFYDLMGMSVEVFYALLSELCEFGGLRSSRNGLTAAEKLCIFLYQLRTGVTMRPLRNRFQHSSSTISRAFHQVLNGLVCKEFYARHVFFPPDECPPEIRNNPKFWPYFKDCRGTTDGSHFAGHFPSADAERYRNRKGWLSQTVLACATFCMHFFYVLAGWEGSAADGRLWEYARSTDLAIPAGKYLLGDAGFPSCDALLVPYRGVRYHLKEWAEGDMRPQNREELFNLRHASARNVIERIFGVAKRKFPLIVRAAEYLVATQAKLVCAMAAVFNFVRRREPRSVDATPTMQEARAFPDPHLDAHDGETDVAGDLALHVSNEEKERADARRDTIATEMWDDYLEYIQQNPGATMDDLI